jgi:hypothetical protein
MPVTLVEFPSGNLADIPARLRNLADQIERGEFGNVRNVVWVVATRSEEIETGLLGTSPLPAADACHMLGRAKHKIEAI